MGEVTDSANSLKIQSLELLKDISSNLLRDLSKDHRDRVEKCYSKVMDALHYEGVGLDQWDIYKPTFSERRWTWCEDYNHSDIYIKIPDSPRQIFDCALDRFFRFHGKRGQSKPLPADFHGEVKKLYRRTVFHKKGHPKHPTERFISLTPSKCKWEFAVAEVWLKNKHVDATPLIKRLEEIYRREPTRYVLHNDVGDPWYEVSDREEALKLLLPWCGENEELINKWLDEKFKRYEEN